MPGLSVYSLAARSASTLSSPPRIARQRITMKQVADQDSLALIRDLEDHAPIDVKVGEAISTLWQGERRHRTIPSPAKRTIARCIRF